MNKKVIISIFIFFMSFALINKVSAISCADIDEKIDKYNSYKDQLEGVDCTDTSNEDTVAVCNSVTMQKNTLATQLMKINDENSACSSNKSEVKKIAKENEGKCGKVFDDDLTDIVNNIMTFFYIIGPILLIVLGTIDYTKATLLSDPKALKKANQRFIKRAIATVLLFISPVIVNIIISLNVSDYYLSGNAYACDFDYMVYNKEYSIKYVPKVTKSNSITYSGGTKQGNYTIFEQGDSQWSNEKLLCSSSSTIGSAGCALSSIAMQIVNSGVETTETINPSSLNKIMKNNGSCSGALMIWEETSYATNNKFTLYKNGQITGGISDKATQLSTYLSQGYYPVIQVKCEPGKTGCSHYVAVFSVENGNIIVGDPADGQLKILNNTDYKIAKSKYSSQVLLYQASN